MTGYAREGRHTVTPRLVTADVAGLVGFIRRVFDAEGDLQAGRPTDLRLGDSIIMVSDGGGLRPSMPGFLYVYVADTDATYRLAIEAGAEVIDAPDDMPWGDRRATVADRWGNIWQIAACRGAGR